MINLFIYKAKLVYLHFKVYNCYPAAAAVAAFLMLSSPSDKLVVPVSLILSNIRRSIISRDDPLLVVCRSGFDVPYHKHDSDQMQR